MSMRKSALMMRKKPVQAQDYEEEKDEEEEYECPATN